MATDRSRERTGRHASVAGDAADRVVESLVRQFDDPHAFVRELVQNSLDAGAVRIDVDMAYDDSTLTIVVRDDGEGMDRETIEGYLLVKFRSTKEDDLTKIGKFGIGFVALFAMRPERVTVDTGRDGTWHRVEFAADLSYTLIRESEPFEGTTVTLEVACDAAVAARTCALVRDRAERWCRFAHGDIRTSASGVAGGWGSTPVKAAFALTGPTCVRDESDGFLAVMEADVDEPTGFYNRGITLLEERGAGYIPGVAFRVDDSHLEHTLTRDNVIRDAAFARVMRRLQRLAEGPLGDAVHLEAEQAARSRDAVRLQRFWAWIKPTVPWTWRTDAPIIPTITGEPLSVAQIEGVLGGWLFAREVYAGQLGDPLAEALAAAGHRVAMATIHDGHLSFLTRRGIRVVPVDSAWQVATRVEEPGYDELFHATGELVSRELHAATLLGTAISGRLAYSAADPFALVAAGTRGEGPVAVSVQHPLVLALARVPTRVAAPVLARALALDCGLRGPDLSDLIAAARGLR